MCIAHSPILHCSEWKSIYNFNAFDICNAYFNRIYTMQFIFPTQMAFNKQNLKLHALHLIILKRRFSFWAIVFVLMLLSISLHSKLWIALSAIFPEWRENNIFHSLRKLYTLRHNVVYGRCIWLFGHWDGVWEILFHALWIELRINFTSTYFYLPILCIKRQP